MVHIWRCCGSGIGRPAATAPIRPLAWEPPYASGAALEKTKRPKKPKQTNKKNQSIMKKCNLRYPKVLVSGETNEKMLIGF